MLLQRLRNCQPLTWLFELLSSYIFLPVPVMPSYIPGHGMAACVLAALQD